ncbi:MAG TPA: PAC2 family protein [Jatrophihabitans sp.]|nr:PAC2 family protein [Jatrophihabitans sp.]
MRNPAKLFRLADELPVLDRPVLVQALDGFVDAGNATQLARRHLLSTLPHQRLATFDVDQLFDYRGRRPEMIFATDHWQSYQAPELALDRVTDPNGVDFLLLSGPEPDLQWERFVAAMSLLVERFDVRLLVGLNAIPMGVPHTRPATVIAHGCPAALVADYANWIGTVQVPAAAGHLMELRLGDAGLPSMGFAVNVPHYLAHLDYPAAAAKLLSCVAAAAELTLPVEVLDFAAVTVAAEVDAQVQNSEQIASVVHALETQFDEIVAGRAQSLVADGGRLPTADELGAEFERFLSQQDGEPPGGGDQAGPPGDPAD